MQRIELSLLVTHQQGISLNSPTFPGDFRGNDHLHLSPFTKEPKELKKMYLDKTGLISMPYFCSFFFFSLKDKKPDYFIYYFFLTEVNTIILSEKM